MQVQALRELGSSSAQAQRNRVNTDPTDAAASYVSVVIRMAVCLSGGSALRLRNKAKCASLCRERASDAHVVFTNGRRNFSTTASCFPFFILAAHSKIISPHLKK